MPSALSPLILFAAIFGFMYFLVIRPQRRRAMDAVAMQKALAPGDEVVTAAGIYGTITEIEDGGTMLLEISEDTEIRIAAASITQVVKKSGEMPTTDVSSQSTPE
jgi:preprotein translocase subunit YajC